MIHLAQSDFVPGKWAMDSYIITQEILHVIQKKRGNTNLMAAKIVTNMPIVTDLGKYLGMPLLLKRKTNLIFHPLLDRIQGRIRSW